MKPKAKAEGLNFGPDNGSRTGTQSEAKKHPTLGGNLIPRTYSPDGQTMFSTVLPAVPGWRTGHAVEDVICPMGKRDDRRR